MYEGSLCVSRVEAPASRGVDILRLESMVYGYLDVVRRSWGAMTFGRSINWYSVQGRLADCCQ